MTVQRIVPAARGGAAAALLFAGVLAGCAGSAERGREAATSIGARLSPVGGGIGHGLITFRPYDGGLVLGASVGGFNSGPYRIVLHTTPVCTSPNGFSAGPPFLLPATGAPVVVPMTIHHEGTATLVVRVPGLALTGPAGIEGRSFVLHAGASGPLDALPGVPNDRVACGVIGAVPTLQL